MLPGSRRALGGLVTDWSVAGTPSADVTPLTTVGARRGRDARHGPTNLDRESSTRSLDRFVNVIHKVNVVHETSPEPVTGREKRRALRTEAILDAALDLLAREGIDAVTLQRVAAEVSCVPAALYRYFSSKDAMLAALQRRVIGELHQRLVEGLARSREQRPGKRVPDVFAIADLLVVVESYLSLPSELPAHHHLVSQMLADPRMLVPADHVPASAAPLSALLFDVAALLDAAVAEGALPQGSSPERTLVLWSSLQGALSLAKLGRFAPSEIDALHLGRVAAHTLITGWGCDPATLSKAARLVGR